MTNRKTYQELIFARVGERFGGEEYVFQAIPDASMVRGLMGLEPRVGRTRSA
jgi:hypothetical protein